MDPDLLPHHLAILKDLQSQKQWLQERVQELDVIERYHKTQVDHLTFMAEREEQRFMHENRGGALSGKTMADAAEAILDAVEDASAGEVAEHLMIAFGYGKGSKDRSYVNALYNAMSRKPDTFVNNDGRWSLKSARTPRAGHQRRFSLGDGKVAAK